MQCDLLTAVLPPRIIGRKLKKKKKKKKETMFYIITWFAEVASK
jgi:hypothetical protein